MPAAVVVPAIIGAAGSVATAGVAAYSANKAADKQIAASNQALSLQKQMYDQTRSDLQPWVTSGGQAATTLGALMGLGGPINGQRQVSAPNTITAGGGQGLPLGTAMMPGGRSMPQGARTPALQNGGSPGTVDMVMLAAPDGSRQAVPRAYVQHYVSQGATVVQ